MINAEYFVACMAKVGLDTYFGVPDSLLKDFCACVEDQGAAGRHVITANEGNAVGMAAGYYLATRKPAVVYLQNSGLGNTINPLVSIADKYVYQIPMLLIIGWRGEPGVKDEPQHLKQGRITREQLDILEIPYLEVDADSDALELANWVTRQMHISSAPVALLVHKNAFLPYERQRKSVNLTSLQREEALEVLLQLAGEAAIVCTTGKTSREVFELRATKGEQQRDFLTVGGMGHTASIALGAALGQPEKKIVCLDGDGSILMHMGALPIIGSLKPKRFVHVLLNNASHDSVGGQPTVANLVDFEAISLACGYVGYAKASSSGELRTAWRDLSTINGPVMLEVCIGTGSREDLGRPTSTPEENKLAFMDWLAI